jgi:hypothetical protein
MEGVSDHEEQRARQQLVELCKDLIDEYGDLDFNDNDDDDEEED